MSCTQPLFGCHLCFKIKRTTKEALGTRRERFAEGDCQRCCQTDQREKHLEEASSSSRLSLSMMDDACPYNYPSLIVGHLTCKKSSRVHTRETWSNLAWLEKLASLTAEFESRVSCCSYSHSCNVQHDMPLCLRFNFAVLCNYACQLTLSNVY